MYKIIGADGQQYGPVSAEQILRWTAENRVRGDTLVQAEGSSDWKPISSFPELTTQAPPGGLPPIPGLRPPLSPPSSVVSQRASTKIPAGVCGILLGGFGVHKFILGYTGAGLIMLLVSLLTCFMAYGVMHIIGLIEGIMYLTKSDEEFVNTYVDGRKEWF